MKILFYDPKYVFAVKDPTYPVGGATIQLKNWVKGFAENGTEVCVLTLNIPGFQYTRQNNVEILPAYKNKKGVRVLRWIYYRIPSIYQRIKIWRPDVVIQAKASFITGIIAIICNILRIPFVYRVANDIETDDRLILNRSYFDSMLFKFALKFTNAIICQNQYQEQNIKKKLPNKPIKIIYNPYHFDNDKYKGNLNRRYVAWLGIFQQQKNLPRLYQIIKDLPQVDFKIAGNYFDKLDHESLEALSLIEKCKNADLVGYLQKDQVNDFLSQAYLLLNTSHYEGFSNTFLESFAAGTPVVTSRKVDPDSIIFRNKLGISVETPNDFQDAISCLINDSNYRQISLRCINYVRENHDLQKLSQDYLRFLNNVNKK